MLFIKKCDKYNLYEHFFFSFINFDGREKKRDKETERDRERKRETERDKDSETEIARQRKSEREMIEGKRESINDRERAFTVTEIDRPLF